ncbi:major facilitator superfamily domain-containing protein [Xylariales sp. PMI_506]|nr:major facilitator superfamily domain-containing protein [Xylariales sp. PMI_506]
MNQSSGSAGARYLHNRDKSGSISIDVEDTGLDLVDERSPWIGAGSTNARAIDSEGGDPEADEYGYLPRWRRPSVYWLIGPYLLYTLAFGGIMIPRVNLVVSLICRQYYAEQSRLDPAFSIEPVALGGDNPQCLIADVQRRVAALTLAVGTVTGALSALVVPRLGSLSDRYGRTRLLALTSCGGLAGEVFFILAARLPDAFDYRWLLLGALLDGATGSFTAGSILATSYASDCTPPAHRAVHMGYLHACMSAGFALGPMVAGYLVQWTGSLLSVFYSTLACHLAFILFVGFAVPESVTKARQLAARSRVARDERQRMAKGGHTGGGHRYSLSASSNSGGIVSSSRSSRAKFISLALFNLRYVYRTASAAALRHFGPLKLLVPSGRGDGPVRRNIVFLSLIDVIVMSVGMGSGMVTILYLEATFHWGTVESSQYASLLSMVRAAGLMVVLPLINKFCRGHVAESAPHGGGGGGDDDDDDVDEDDANGRAAAATTNTNRGVDEFDLRLLRGALLLETAGTLGYVLAPGPGLFIAAGVVASFGGIAGPLVQAALTKHVASEQVGSLLGALGLLQSLGRIVAPVVFSSLYAATVVSWPRAFFVLLCAFFTLALTTSLRLRPHVYLRSNEYQPMAQFPEDSMSPDGPLEEIRLQRRDSQSHRRLSQ